MKKMYGSILSFAVIVAAFSVSCVKNSTEIKPLDTTVAGKWQGFIVPINLGDIHFNGAKVFFGISGKDSTFRMIARDTTKSQSSPIKDTILVISGAWTVTHAPDSVVLQCTFCRVIDTTKNILYNRSIDNERVPLPQSITKSDEGYILWEISFADLSPLIPLLGLTIPAETQSMMKQLIIAIQKMSQE
jgi:hypothetical protein